MADIPEDLRDYCTALGRAVANWQTAEERMEFLFCSLAESKYAPLIFNAISNTRDKLAILDELMQHRFASHPISDDWNALHNKIGRMVRRRNKLVHSYPVLAPIPGRPISLPICLNDGNWEYLSGPATYTKRALLLDPAQRLKTYKNTLQITQLGRAFELLAGRISVFGNVLTATIEQQTVSASQQADRSVPPAGTGPTAERS